MDALAAFGVNWKLLLIQGVNFGLLLALLYRYLYKPMFALLAKRQAIITEGLADAQTAKEEKARIALESEQILRAAREEGGKLVETLHKQGLEEERKLIRDAQEKSTLLLAEAKQKANEERAHILRETEGEIARMALLAAEKILRANGVKQ